MFRTLLGTFFVVCILSQLADASFVTNSPIGINSIGLSNAQGALLTGEGIGIGQVEPHRPGDEDAFDTQSFRNSTIDPALVAYRDDDSPTPNEAATVQDHASWVAGVMISTDNVTAGVARNAELYSSAADPMLPFADQHFAIASQFISTQNDDDIRVINMSGGTPLSGGNTLFDGNQLLTQFVDWSASAHEVLYVVAGVEDGPIARIPSDNFNGLTVAASTLSSGVFRRVASFNNYNSDATGERTSISLLAPGDNVQLAGLNDTTSIEDGTSFAAPHVTGTVALLQQYGDERIMNAPSDQWNVNGNARRHEVMKAVLMNSADKLIDNGTVDYPGTTTNIPEGRLLGMERTVLKQNGTDTWFQSEAFLEAQTSLFDTPLDDQMGVGHLNAKRALQQFIPGEHELNGNFGEPTVGEVPHIGWDFGTISTPPSFPINKYRIEGTLEAGHFFSATLAWDRTVEFANDADMDGEYDLNDTFQDYTDLSDVLQDLDLYLVPAGTNDVGENDILVSQSSVTSVEHIFGEIPETGEYELWVYRNEVFVPDQNYGLAWWYGLAPDIEPPDDVTGDFDNDGDADGNDFLAWQRGSSPAPFSPGDLSDWQSGYGSPLSAAAAVPEPSSLVVVLLFGSVLISRCRV